MRLKTEPKLIAKSTVKIAQRRRETKNHQVTLRI